MTVITISIDTENPSGYAGDDTTEYIDCPSDIVDQVVQELCDAINVVFEKHGLMEESKVCERGPEPMLDKP